MTEYTQTDDLSLTIPEDFGIWKELSSRESGECTIRLMWDSHRAKCALIVVRPDGEEITVPVANCRALDAFLHPFLYVDA